MNVEEQVREVILEILDVKAEEIVPTATLIEDLGASSIDLVEIFTALQNIYDIEIDEEKGSTLKTIQDVTEYLQSAVA